MFVRLENGELLNLNHVIRIFVEQHRVMAEYARGETVRFATIHSGTEHQCNFAFNMLRNSLDVISTEISAQEDLDDVR